MQKRTGYITDKNKTHDFMYSHDLKGHKNKDKYHKQIEN